MLFLSCPSSQPCIQQYTREAVLPRIPFIPLFMYSSSDLCLQFIFSTLTRMIQQQSWYYGHASKLYEKFSSSNYSAIFLQCCCLFLSNPYSTSLLKATNKSASPSLSCSTFPYLIAHCVKKITFCQSPESMIFEYSSSTMGANHLNLLCPDLPLF